jgi:hypothetical protein
VARSPNRLARAIAAVLLSAAARPAAAEGLRVAAFPETLRFDPDTERFLEAGRPDAPQDPAPFELRVDPLRLTAARGEVVAFQLVVTGSPGPHRVAVTPAVDDAGNASPLVLSTFDARAIDVDSPSVSPRVFSLGPGSYPDALVPTATVTVPHAAGLAVLWVDVFVPAATAPGVHEAAVLVGEREVPLEVEVLDVTLPEADVARLGAVNFGSIAERGKRDPALELRWMQLAHAHHLSVELMRPVPAIDDAGTAEWAGWVERVRPYVEGSAFTAARGYVGPRPGLPTTRFVIPLTDWWPVPATDAHLPSDPARWSRALAEWERAVKGAGWFDRPNATE